jgi:hypothetical protein
MSDLHREAIADLVIENAALRRRIALLEELLAQRSAMLYENLAAALPPDERRYTIDGAPPVDTVLALLWTTN